LRGYKEEIDNSAGHGTHVAGLASYDNKAIGIIPVRVLPTVTKIGKNAESKFDAIDEKEEDVLEKIFKGIEYSINSGARVINLSLGATKELRGDDKPTIEYQKIKNFAVKLEKLMNEHPKVLAVAAAGNDGKWIDQNSRFNFPCGTNAKNILCVGALKNNGDLANFTNIALKKETQIVYASGVDLFSTYPQKMCTDQAKTAFDLTDVEKFEPAFLKDCVQAEPKIVKMSGTSMASPIVARMAAEILIKNPNLNGQQVIQALLRNSYNEETSELTLPLKKLKAQKPSWYNNPSSSEFSIFSLGIVKILDEFKNENWINLWVPAKK